MSRKKGDRAALSQDPEGLAAESREARDRFLQQWGGGLIDRDDLQARIIHHDRALRRPFKLRASSG
jgi:hypothetical protein